MLGVSLLKAGDTHTDTRHHAVVSLGADDSPHALSSLPHSIKSQEVTLLDLEHLSHVLQPCPVMHTRHNLPASLKARHLPAVAGSAGLDTFHNMEHN